jgi:hypothetical protein
MHHYFLFLELIAKLIYCLKPRININICKRGKRVNLKIEMVVLELIKSDV